MSGENVEIARRTLDAWNEGGPEAAKRFWAEDFEFHDAPNLPDSRVVRGRDAVAAYLESQIQVIGEMKVVITDVKDGGDKVAFRLSLNVHGVESGVDVPGEIAQVYEVAVGEVTRTRVFLSWDEALEAAGLSE
jgi:ketosteroid isomerase-like protein